MYIEPNGQVKLMHTGLPSDYTDTIYFDNVTAQYNYFANLAGTWLNAQSYTRVNRGVFRCSLPMRETYNVDYMMFRNQAFENKWFYAFVNKINYVNNGLCEIRFTIDIIQSWFISAGGQSALGSCFISREHVANDDIGANVEAESLTTGEYICEDNSKTTLASDLFEPAIILAGVGSGKPNGKLYNKVYGGATLYAFKPDDSEGVNTVIEEVTRLHGDDNGIVGLYMAPIIALPSHTIPAQGVPISEGTGETEIVEIPKLTHETGFNGYIPKNNKLYTYPYNFCRITTGQGSHADYPYEYFINGNPTFKLGATILAPVTAICLPVKYKGFSDTNIGYEPEAISISNYPQCSWSNDVYAAWVAQNSVPIQNIRQAYEDKANVRADYLSKNQSEQNWLTFMQLAESLIGVDTGDVTGYVNTVAKRAVQQNIDWNNWAESTTTGRIDIVTSQMNAEYSAAARNNNVFGSSTGNITLALNDMKFTASRWHLRPERLIDIDNYFSMFGYAYNKVEIPNITSRPHWNYVQTVDANIKGDMPSDDRQLLKSMFEKGIRFWKNGSEIGNYDLDNSPLQA